MTKTETDIEFSHLMATRPWCYTIVETQNPAEHGGYVPSVVIQDVSGHFPMTGRGKGSAPWVWGKTLDQAQEVCRQANARRGIDEKTAFKILASTMRCEICGAESLF
jgi:hypothetical protein